MTLQQIVERVPHALLEQVARFCGDNEMRKCVINKGDGDFKLELVLFDHVKR